MFSQSRCTSVNELDNMVMCHFLCFQTKRVMIMTVMLRLIHDTCTTRYWYNTLQNREQRSRVSHHGLKLEINSSMLCFYRNT